MQDRMTTARAALVASAKAFREYQAHHEGRALTAASGPDAFAAREKAQRNRRLAMECETAVALLEADV